MTRTSTTISALISACVLLTLSGPASAQHPKLQQGQSTTVDVSDLDLSIPGDAEIMYGRIHVAARKVCTLKHDMPERRRIQRRLECIATAIEDAVNRTNRSQLTAVHRAAESGERLAGL